MTTSKVLAALIGSQLPADALPPGLDIGSLDLSQFDLSGLDPRNFGLDPSILGLDPSFFDALNSNTPAIAQPGDGAQLSPEAAGESAAANAPTGNSGGGNWNQVLMQDVMGVVQAQASGGDPQSAVAGLSRDYSAAQQQQAQIDPTVQATVQAILGQQAGSGSPGSQGPGGSGGGTGSSPAAAGMAASGAVAPNQGGTAPSNQGGGSMPINQGGGTPATAGPGQTWNGQLQQSLASALSATPQDFQNSMGSWAQGQEGDCASVAVIKAAMNEYGNQVLSSVTQGPNGYNITMQDGFQETITPQMLSQASQMGDFTGADNQSKAYATLLYAAMAGRAAQTGVDGITTFTGALQDMAAGYDPTVAAQNLGVENHMVAVNPANLGNDASVVGWSSQHAVFVQNGSTVDHYGTAEAYNGTDTLGDALTNAFELTPDSYPSQSYSVSSRPSRAASAASAAVSGPHTPGSARAAGVPRAVGFLPPAQSGVASRRSASTMPRPQSPSSAASGWHTIDNPWHGTRHPGGRQRQ